MYLPCGYWKYHEGGLNMYKYYNDKGEYLIGYKDGNKVIVDSEVYTEYEMVYKDARYIRVNGVRYIREDFIDGLEDDLRG